MTELQRDKDASKELMVLNLHSIYWGSDLHSIYWGYQYKSTNTDAEAAG